MSFKVRLLAFICMAALLAMGCRVQPTNNTNAFLLRSNELSLDEASRQLHLALLAELQAGGLLQVGYPQAGRVALEPDAANPGAQLMRCAVGASAEADGANCLLLNPAGDFARVQPIGWESAAFYMYRMYVAPPSLFAKINPAQGFVAVDIFLMEEPELWEAVDQAILDAAQGLGARPYRP